MVGNSMAALAPPTSSRSQRAVQLFLFGIVFCLAALTAPQSLAQTIEASVDRQEVARGDTLTLTLRVFNQRQGMQLDLNPLTEQFDVLATRSSVQMRSINGNTTSWTDYIVTLFPLEEGELTIPALNVNGITTDPIAVTVVNQGAMSNQASGELFLEIEVNKDEVYVQEQLLFTVRLFYTLTGIRNPIFTDLDIPDTVTRLIGSPNQYERLIDGERYGVYEKRYVIFPQRSGTLEIPDQLFRGEVTDGSSNFVFRNLNTRRVTAFTEGTSVEVKERPAGLADASKWLPLTDLQVIEEWSSDLDNLRVGDTLIRKITLVAQGVDGAVIPPLSIEQVEGINYYPDPPEIEHTFIDGSIVGTRVESSSIVPLQDGLLNIPAIEIPWWDITADELRTAVVPARQLVVANVQGIVPAEQLVASEGNIEELLATAPEVDQDMIDEQGQAELIEIDSLWFNLLMAAAIVIVMFAIYRLVLAKHQSALSNAIRSRVTRVGDHYSAVENEKTAYRQLRSACSGSDRLKIRGALITWCKHYFANARVRTMEDVMQQSASQELATLASALQASLFNNGSIDFDANQLARLVASLRKEKLREQKQQERKLRYALPALYKA